MMKVAYLLIQRNAAKEQRKGRASRPSLINELHLGDEDGNRISFDKLNLDN